MSFDDYLLPLEAAYKWKKQNLAGSEEDYD